MSRRSHSTTYYVTQYEPNGPTSVMPIARAFTPIGAKRAANRCMRKTGKPVYVQYYKKTGETGAFNQSGSHDPGCSVWEPDDVPARRNVTVNANKKKKPTAKRRK